MINNFDDESSEDVQAKPLDLNVVRANVPTYPSDKLCEMIVCDRYFGCFREIAVMCMEELAKRRTAGDPFVFEKYIDDAFKKLPELNFATPNLREVLQRAIKMQGIK
jgi:hypothetical protein